MFNHCSRLSAAGLLPRCAGCWRASPSVPARRAIAATPRPDWINGVSPSLAFKRFFDAPTMDAAEVVRTARDLVSERSSDVFLFQALSRRFHAHAEEFFPPQIDDLLSAFAELGYADEPLLLALRGRLEDVMLGASPRRVVRVLRNAAILRLEPQEWLGTVLEHLDRQMPNLREGVPAVLASLHAMRFTDPEVIDLLLAQGLLVSDDLGESYFARLFEQWSRHGARNAEAEELAVGLASSIGTADIRDALNILAALRRYKDHARAAHELEGHIEKRLRSATAEEVALALSWMERLAVCSESLWMTCSEVVETSVQTKDFVRDSMPGAVHALASLSLSRPGEAMFLAKLLSASRVRKAVPKFRAPQPLRLLRAACLAAVTCEPGSHGELDLVSSLDWPGLVMPAARLSRQCLLPERRQLAQVSEILRDLDVRYQLQLGEHLQVLDDLPVPSLRARKDCSLDGSAEQAIVDVELGGDALLCEAGREEAQRGIKFLGPGDVFASPRATKVEGMQLTPACRLAVRALELQGWTVEMRA